MGSGRVCLLSGHRAPGRSVREILPVLAAAVIIGSAAAGFVLRDYWLNVQVRWRQARMTAEFPGPFRVDGSCGWHRGECHGSTGPREQERKRGALKGIFEDPRRDQGRQTRGPGLAGVLCAHRPRPAGGVRRGHRCRGGACSMVTLHAQSIDWIDWNPPLIEVRHFSADGDACMSYIFENLGADRFQQLCQALLVKDYRDLQCFPVGQPDGGRDALSRGDGGAVPTTVGQVKFKKSDEEENADWMISALKGELPKIERLVAQGATRYIMMTNARGTAHEEVGRVDRVQAWLDEHVSIEAFCLWRDELERRLDGDQSIKLSYPAMLTGDDTLTLIVKALMGPHQVRLSRVLRAFVAEQYRKDEEVKFRQVELANSLLGLFVDVPVDVTAMFWGTAARHVGAETQSAIRRMAVLRRDRYSSPDDVGVQGGGAAYTAGAADVLLATEVQSGIPWIVLHGAPGQGKSTLAQYVCQVHRARYLEKNEFLGLLPGNHAGASFRLPLKVDLRDLAGYLDGRSFLGQHSAAGETHRTLERFLSLMISIQSGGLEFSPDDFVETAASVPVLLFLDGLDEVADLDLRKVLVERVVEGLNRLKEMQADIQVVITSRPSLFGQPPSFSRSFFRLDLAPIGTDTINAYADKWVLAKRLDEDRALEVKDILTDKLHLGHIRDLTRNPMQLTILLSLINSVGYSLPDVRTDLYRQYVDLFMTREAEKSPIVREHRPLLLEIVEYLAWVLQCSAESDGSSGSVTRDELRSMIADRLTASNQKLDILDDLFSGGLERVYVLVQRIEGLYEFEVQPLREYFAAKFLYSSAPVGSFRHVVVHGDRAQRFEAIAVNPYWANVTRFYAGFYAGGEIGALNTSLRELTASKKMGESVSARSIGSALLRDWIFRSKAFVQDEVINLVFDPVGVHLASLSKLSGFEKGSLPDECGRETLARLLFTQYISPVDARPMRSLCFLLQRNGGELLGQEFSEWAEEVTGSERTRRLGIALASGGFSNIEVSTAEQLLLSDNPSPSELNNRLTSTISSEPYWADSSSLIAESMIRSLLEWGGLIPVFATNDVARLAWFITPHAFRGPELPPPTDDSAKAVDVRVSSSAKTLSEVVAILERASQDVLDKGSWDEGDPWNDQIEAMRAACGDTWSTYRLAIANVGLTAARDRTAAFDISGPLFSQARFARNWRGRTSWWEPLLRSEDAMRRLFWAAMMLAWAPPKHVAAFLGPLGEIVNGLSDDDYERLREVLDVADTVRRYRGGRLRGPVPDVSNREGSRLIRCLVIAFGEAQVVHIPNDVKSSEPAIQTIFKRHALTVKLKEFHGWKNLSTRKRNEWLGRFQEAQTEGIQLPDETQRMLYSGVSTLEEATIVRVLHSATLYPREVVNAAYAVLQESYKPVVVREIAEKEGWTFE